MLGAQLSDTSKMLPWQIQSPGLFSQTTETNNKQQPYGNYELQKIHKNLFENMNVFKRAYLMDIFLDRAPYNTGDLENKVQSLKFKIWKENLSVTQWSKKIKSDQGNSLKS